MKVQRFNGWHMVTPSPFQTPGRDQHLQACATHWPRAGVSNQKATIGDCLVLGRTACA